MKTIELFTSIQGWIVLFSYILFFGTFFHAVFINYKRKKKGRRYRSLDHYIGILIISLVGFLPNELHVEKLNLHNLIIFYFFLATIIYYFYFIIKDEDVDFSGAILMFMLASYLTSINFALNTLIEGDFYMNPFLLLGLLFCLMINFVYLSFKRNQLE